MKEYDTDGLDLSIMRPVDAVRVSMERATDGKDTISVTGNGTFDLRRFGKILVSNTDNLILRFSFSSR